ncbi:stage II sporulation protein M [Staphylococcus epidermidis]|uniref:stage II sporulation protein M n=1 Tax=Staphylococcus epidermidis TaxID=1282 RepID=UPI002092227C|nr:stage II sporulation protein M [Staphylococcus epidermidis]MCO6330798.1 stage II sporulation protein M [Staphylococcus epidermidis]
MKNRAYLISFFTTVFLFAISIIVGFNIKINSKQSSNINPNSALDIIINNLQANMNLASGFLTLGIGTIIFIFLNGSIIGSSIKESNLSNIDIFFSLAPHGILEIPAMILSSMIGFQVIEFVFILFFSTNKTKKIMISFFKILFFRIILVILLTIFAGLIEWYITFKIF